MNKKLLTAAPPIQGGYLENSTKLQRGGKTSGLTCLDNCLINSDIDFPHLSSQFKDIQLQLHATKVTNPYTFSIQGNKSFSGICELDKPSYVIAYGSEPWYYSDWPDASKVLDLTIINGGVKFSVKNAINLRSMFENCSKLTSLDLSNFNTSNVTDMYFMFYGCSGLTSLDLSNFNTSNVTDMRYMFRLCSKLTSLDLSNFNTSNVTYMSYMFSGCSGLTSLDLSNFNTSNVTDMGDMFYECSDLTSLDLSNFNTSNVTDMRDMFENCSGLTSLNLSNFDTSNVTDMRYMFRLCSKLTSLDLSNFNTSNVTSMKYMFYGCSALETLDYSLTGFWANGIAPDLSECTSLKTLRLHHAIPAAINNFIELAKVPSTCNVIHVS